MPFMGLFALPAEREPMSDTRPCKNFQEGNYSESCKRWIESDRPKWAKYCKACGIKEAVSPDYFRTLGIPQLAGRSFDERDTETTELVVIINETFARRFFPNENPIDRLVKNGTENRQSSWMRVAAVLLMTVPTFAQTPGGNLFGGNDQQLGSGVREAIRWRRAVCGSREYDIDSPPDSGRPVCLPQPCGI
jgi:hypothetical protein